ncbi:hypothetical protein [Nocardia amamiensis]|uniref:hypothetical protein n=1 Tax=Nocardia amamiensis TaxID=404578 RepID=UPI001E5801BB|nr:hypothetical protein [Nocardia amamiensis]
MFPPPPPDLADDEATQTERRFDLLHLEPFRYNTPAGVAAWIAHLDGLAQSMRLFDAAPDMLTGGNMPEYLFRRTNGVVGLLERLIEDGCTEAINTGVENLTSDLLDTITINLGNIPGPARTNDEILNIPITPGPEKRKRRRNTVFDDRGLPPAIGNPG